MRIEILMLEFKGLIKDLIFKNWNKKKFINLSKRLFKTLF